jgi:hypothetical protein
MLLPEMSPTLDRRSLQKRSLAHADPSQRGWYADFTTTGTFNSTVISPFYDSEAIGKTPSLDDSPGLAPDNRFEAISAACCLEGALKGQWVGLVYWGAADLSLVKDPTCHKGSRAARVWMVSLGRQSVPMEFRVAMKQGLELVETNRNRLGSGVAQPSEALPCK